MIAGVGLPLLVVLAFALARLAPRYYVEDPKYDVVYSVGGGYTSTPTDRVCVFVVVEGRLRVRWNAAEQTVYPPPQRVYRLDAASGELVELSVPEPDDLAAAGGHVELFVAGLEDVRLDTSPRASDGYEFESNWSGGGGLFGELFFGGSRGMRSAIHRDGRRIEVPHPGQEPYGYGTMSFLGWAVPAGAGR